MSDYQVDPYKLNEVLQKILDKLSLVEEKSNSASPEFQVLMNNYLTKANEAERNQARFEEALERLELAEQESKKLKILSDELRERIRTIERDFENLQSKNTKEINNLQEKLSKNSQEKDKLEKEYFNKYQQDLKEARSSSEKQIIELQTEIGEVLQIKRKLEEKVLMKNQESDLLEKELNDLKIKLADEQANIRNEIIEATKRSHSIEQKFQTEKDSLSKKLRELERINEELSSELILKRREVEYKDALLTQAIKRPSPEVNPLSVSKTASLLNNPSDELPPEAPQNFSPQPEPYREEPTTVGGIWSKLT